MGETLSIADGRRGRTDEARTLRAVALPAEHGGWGLLAEPLLLGFLVAPSLAGTALALAAACAFLARHPARLAFGDWRRGVSYPRTRLAFGLAMANALAAVGGLGVALILADGPLAWYLALIVPPAAVFLWFDLRMQGRDLRAELSGAVALTATAGALVVAAGWPLARAWPLWLLVGGRAVASVVEVRTRLRRRRGLPASAAGPLVVHAAFAAAAVAVVAAGLAPKAAPLVPIALLARAAWNLRESAAAPMPQQVGWSEVRAGALALVVWVAAYRILG